MEPSKILLGIVVRAEPRKDSDICARVLTSQGLMTLNAIGAQKPTAKLKSSVQPFTIAEFTIIGHRITSAHIIQSGHNIAKDIKKYYLACAICEVVMPCCQHDDDTGGIFEMTVKAFELLNQSDTNCKEVFAWYFSGLLVELGYGVEEDVDLNTSFLRHLDIIIPNTAMFL